MKISELSGDNLNAVIKRIVLQDGLYTQDSEIYTKLYIDPDGWVFLPNTSIGTVHKVPPKFTRQPTIGKFDPCNNWGLCKAIANFYRLEVQEFGTENMEAALRAVVALRLGDEVEL